MPSTARSARSARSRSSRSAPARARRPGCTSTSRPTTWPPRWPGCVALGATVLEEREGYTILRDPAGLVFCVVPVQTGDDFEREALTWDD